MNQTMNLALNNQHKIGHKVELHRTFTEKDTQEFAAVTGDTNLIHLDEEYAATTQFKQRIVHGMNVASLFSTIFGTIYPGLGTIYVSQTLKFKAPVYIGDRIKAEVELVNIHESKPIGYFSTLCFNQQNKLVIEGQAVLLLPKAARM